MVSKESRQKVRVKKHKRMRNHLSGTAWYIKPPLSKTTVLIPFSTALLAITVPKYAAASTLLVFSSSALISFSRVEAATNVFPTVSSII